MTHEYHRISGDGSQSHSYGTADSMPTIAQYFQELYSCFNNISKSKLQDAELKFLIHLCVVISKLPSGDGPKFNVSEANVAHAKELANNGANHVDAKNRLAQMTYKAGCFSSCFGHPDRKPYAFIWFSSIIITKTL